MLSVIIPARNEAYLQKTIESVLSAAVEDIEVIAVCDGYWPEPPILDNPKVNLIHHSEARGQRQSINEAARIAKGKYIMKLDAHCAVAPGFDKVLKEDCQYDWTMVPRMYNLDISTYTPKKHKVTDYMYITFLQGKEFRMEYYGGSLYRKLHANKAEIDDTMCLVGCCFFMHKDRFWELGGMDEGHGSWGQMGCEVSCKAWLSGGALKVNKKTWFSHWFRGGGGPGFPYSISGRSVNQAREYSKDLWLNDKWPLQKRKFQWMLDKFNPPAWVKNETKDIFALKNKHKGQRCTIVGNSESILNIRADMFEEGPIIAINEAIEKVEELGLSNPVYAMMKDGGDKKNCPACPDPCGHLIKPKEAPLLLSKAQSEGCLPNHPVRYIFDTSHWFDKDTFSAAVALKIAQLFGCRKIDLLCCEGGGIRVSHGDSTNRRYATYKKHHKIMSEIITKDKLYVNWRLTRREQDDYRFIYYRHVITRRQFPRWRGVGVIKHPEDMILYHQAIWQNKPDVIIETGTAHSGSALFYADMLEMTGKGQVISIDIAPRSPTVPHPRVTYITGSSIDKNIVEQVRQMVGDKTCMVTLDSKHTRIHVKWELHYYAPMVTKGQFLVVEDVYTRGRNILYGPGQALQWFLRFHPEFERTKYDRQFLTGVTRDGWIRKL